MIRVSLRRFYHAAAIHKGNGTLSVSARVPFGFITITEPLRSQNHRDQHRNRTQRTGLPDGKGTPWCAFCGKAIGHASTDFSGYPPALQTKRMPTMLSRQACRLSLRRPGSQTTFFPCALRSGVRRRDERSSGAAFPVFRKWRQERSDARTPGKASRACQALSDMVSRNRQADTTSILPQSTWICSSSLRVTIMPRDIFCSAMASAIAVVSRLRVCLSAIDSQT